jgi:hypothetical protein
LDDADEHHFIRGNIAISHHPLVGTDRKALALLKAVLISDIHHHHIQDQKTHR